MILLQAKDITKRFGTDEVLRRASLMVRAGDRVALVGVNGAGKTTFLKMLTGEMSPDDGEIVRARNTDVGYVAQKNLFNENVSIWDNALEVFADLQGMEKHLREIEMQLTKQSTQELLGRYEEAQEEFKNRGGYEYQAKMRAVLSGFRFFEQDWTRSVAELSGGQRTRLAMAMLLLREPELLILDEPTNHLDMETLAWLESFLKRYSGAILMVSHDRQFLDELANVTVELERGKTTRYEGNYSRYLEQKAAASEQQEKLYNRQQEEIARQEDFVRRNIARATTSSRAKSRQKMLERIERIERPDSELRRAQFEFGIMRASGRVVLTTKNLGIGYGNKILAQNINLQLLRGERVGILAPNGAGKTTFLRSIAGQLELLKGEQEWGHQVQVGYYDQEQNLLNPEKTVVAEVWDDFPDRKETEIRTALGNFLFSGDDVQKKISQLSGGEKARVALVKLMLRRDNVLLLDEPTNHLDIFSKETLEQVLEDYEGTILFISHDRYFLNRIATHILVLKPEGIESHLGNYADYLERGAAANATSAAAQSVVSMGRDRFENEREEKKREKRRQKRIEDLQKDIETLEGKIRLMEEDLCKPEVFQDAERSRKTNAELMTFRQKLDAAYAEWETLEGES